MGTAKTSKKTAETGRKKAFHPLFPNIDAAAIASVSIYRLVKGARNRFTPELLEGPLDPSSVTSDLHLKPYGPGHLRVMARRGDGALLGDSYELRLPNDRGQVPVDREDFEEMAVDAANAESEVSQLKRLLNDEREHMRAMLREERERHAADMGSFSTIIDKLNESNAAVVDRILSTQRAPSSEAPAWLRSELRDVRKELAETSKALRDKELAFFKLEAKRASKEGGEDDPAALFKKYSPVIDFVGEMLAERKPAAGAPPTADPHTCIIDGETIPSLAMLREVAQRNGAPSVADVLSEHAVAAFRRLNAKGLLPPAYVEAIGPAVFAQG